MNELIVASDAIRQYGDAAATMAADIVVAAATNQAATIAAAVPVFGLIGQDFLGAFAVAQANNFSSASELAYVYGMTAVAAHEGATLYDATEDAAVADFGAISSSTTR